MTNQNHPQFTTDDTLFFALYNFTFPVAVRMVKLMNIRVPFIILLLFGVFYLIHTRQGLILGAYRPNRDVYNFTWMRSHSLKEYNFFYPAHNPKVVLVFLHIQKTGGTFIEKALTKKGVVGFPCQCTPHVKACNCNRNRDIWLFSR